MGQPHAHAGTAMGDLYVIVFAGFVVTFSVLFLRPSSLFYLYSRSVDCCSSFFIPPHISVARVTIFLVTFTRSLYSYTVVLLAIDFLVKQKINCLRRIHGRFVLATEPLKTKRLTLFPEYQITVPGFLAIKRIGVSCGVL